ncbi:serine/threonine-protein kinase [Okeania sp. SIO2B3]|uniref:serine/threonine-protein kinase n=1 Tax=Okeania sp. SIO2B3 TaxID=2607784 RepID=UPI0013BFA7DD|nr:serine/threonine-protein kinase [Okeania sp. SIO2B3]NET46038.1 protein kinase [Okeania sp. SIO2B3]
MTSRILKHRYKIISELGKGSFGTTYLATDLEHPNHPQCVVKQLTPSDPRPKVFQVAKKLFEKEVKALQNLGKHNQIPTFFNYFEEGGQFYLVQEFIEGNDLAKEIYFQGRFTENETVKLLIEILEVLKYVHQQNVIHRDLKLQNIMRKKSDGKIVLIDFGAVKEIKVLTVTSGGHATTTIAVGTTGYMPSEQAAGKPKFCSDIYAVGMIGIEVLTGMRINQFRENPSTGEIIWKDQVNVSNNLGRILDKMVAEYWKNRYQTVDEAIGELRKIGKRPLSYKPLGIAASIAALLGVALFGVASIFSKGVIEAGQGKDVEAMYNSLDALAEAGQWQKADRQNWQLINQIGDRDGDYSYISVSEAEQFSCPDLERINQIWTQRSKGKFGYTAQLQVIDENGDTLEAFRDDVRAWRRFAIAVGWKTGTDKDDDGYFKKNDLQFTIDAPKGHLSTDGENFALILTRAAQCQL